MENYASQAEIIAPIFPLPDQKRKNRERQRKFERNSQTIQTSDENVDFQEKEFRTAQ